MAVTGRPAAASDSSTERKSSLLPVYPGTSKAGCRSPPPGGTAHSAANGPRDVRMVVALTRGDICSDRGVLTARQPTYPARKTPQPNRGPGRYTAYARRGAPGFAGGGRFGGTCWVRRPGYSIDGPPLLPAKAWTCRLDGDGPHVVLSWGPAVGSCGRVCASQRTSRRLGRGVRLGWLRGVIRRWCRLRWCWPLRRYGCGGDACGGCRWPGLPRPRARPASRDRSAAGVRSLPWAGRRLAPSPGRRFWSGAVGACSCLTAPSGFLSLRLGW